MKNSVSNIWLIGIVTLFIFVFAGYLAVTISYSSAFKLKNEALTIIEKHKGMTSKAPKLSGGKYKEAGALETVNAYLHGMGYKVMGKCPISKKGEPTWYGVSSLDYTKQASYESVKSNKKYYYCFMQDDVSYAGSKHMNAKYYKLMFFYKMELPVVGDIFTFEVPGTTAEIYYDQAGTLHS